MNHSLLHACSLILLSLLLAACTPDLAPRPATAPPGEATTARPVVTAPAGETDAVDAGATLAPIATAGSNASAVATALPSGEATALPGFQQPAGSEPGWLFHGSGDALPAIAFAPAGQILATGHQDGSVRLWDLATGSQIRQLAAAVPGASGSEIAALAFSADGNLLVAAKPGSGSVDVWEVASGAVLTSLAGGLGIADVAFSPDGSLLAGGVARGDSAADLGRVRLWDTAGWQLQLELADVAPDLAFVANTSLATASGLPLAAMGAELAPGAVIFWDLENGSQADVLSLAGYVAAFDYVPGSEHLAVNLLESAAADPGYTSLTLIVDRSSKERLQRLPAPAPGGLPLFVDGVALNPDGSLVAVGYRPDLVIVWDTATGAEVHTFAGPSGALGAPAFSADGALLAAASPDGRILLWRVGE